MQRFKKGDRVRSTWSGDITLGLTGTIILVMDHSYGVSFDGLNRGHNLNKDEPIPNNSGWWITHGELEPLGPKMYPPLFTLEELTAQE